MRFGGQGGYGRTPENKVGHDATFTYLDVAHVHAHVLRCTSILLSDPTPPHPIPSHPSRSYMAS
ncbi:hypothetical protein ACLOJK_012820 [Asimina triloba]